MKRTAYVIKGQSFEEPADLPEGFTVEALEVDDPKRVEVKTWGENTLTIEPHSDSWDGEQVSFTLASSTTNVLLSLDSARQVRDCLNAILGDDKPKRRVFAEKNERRGSWRWWETTPGGWTYDTSWYKASTATGECLINVSWDVVIEEASSELIDVTAEHPEINEGA